MNIPAAYKKNFCFCIFLVYLKKIVAGLLFLRTNFIHQKELWAILLLTNLNLPEHLTYVDVDTFAGYETLSKVTLVLRETDFLNTYDVCRVCYFDWSSNKTFLLGFYLFIDIYYCKNFCLKNIFLYKTLFHEYIEIYEHHTANWFVFGKILLTSTIS